MEALFEYLSPSSIWFMAGAFLILLEITLVTGIGLLFAGLGAISVGAALEVGWIETPPTQFLVFFLATAVWTGSLWKPLKSFIKGKDAGFDDMVGSTAVVFGEAIERGKMGEVKWSGTIMKCQYEPETEASETVHPDTEVIIARVSKGILIVKDR